MYRRLNFESGRIKFRVAGTSRGVAFTIVALFEPPYHRFQDPLIRTAVRGVEGLRGTVYNRPHTANRPSRQPDHSYFLCNCVPSSNQSRTLTPIHRIPFTPCLVSLPTIPAIKPNKRSVSGQP